MRTTFLVLVLLAAVYGLATLGGRAYDIETCDRVVRQSQEHLPGFYITQDEKGACDNRHIKVFAPVR